MTSMSSPPCPTSTATAITSAPMRSARYGMATDVSRPPEYARTTRSVMSLLPLCVAVGCVAVDFVVRGGGSRRANRLRTGLARFPAGSPAGELRRERGTGRARRRSFVARHDEDGVVAGDRANDVDEAGAVQRAREKLRRAGRRTQHDQVAAGVDARQ